MANSDNEDEDKSQMISSVKKSLTIISINDNFKHIEAAIKIKQIDSEKSIEEFMKGKTIIVKTLTNEKGEKVTLGLNEDNTAGRQNIFIDL